MHGVDHKCTAAGCLPSRRPESRLGKSFHGTSSAKVHTLEHYVPKSMQKSMLRAVHRNHLELSKVLILIQGWDGSEIQDSPHAYALAHSEVPGYN